MRAWSVDKVVQGQSVYEMKWMRVTVHQANAAIVIKSDTIRELVHYEWAVTGICISVYFTFK